MGNEVPKEHAHANISYKCKFVWTAPAKTASRSVKDVFREHCDLNPKWPCEDHTSDFSHVNIWPDDVDDDYIHIGNIRHPYYRWLSYWKYAYWGQGMHEIEDVRQGPIVALKRMTEDWISAWTLTNNIFGTNKRVDYLLRAESLFEDLTTLPFIPNNIQLKKIGQTRVPTYPLFDEQKLRDLCFERFQMDYSTFGYEKDDYFSNWDTNKKHPFPIRKI